jgi:plasmid stabilization system protein ParE
MIDLVITPEAECDIEDIADYISNRLHNPTAAMALFQEIYDKILKLIDAPDMGAKLRTEHVYETEYRFLICGNYYIFYRHEADDVYIVRVLYKKRDYMTILFGPDMVNEDAGFEYRIE